MILRMHNGVFPVFSGVHNHPQIVTFCRNVPLSHLDEFRHTNSAGETGVTQGPIALMVAPIIIIMTTVFGVSYEEVAGAFAALRMLQFFCALGI